MWKIKEIQELNLSFEIYEKWPLLNWEHNNVKGFYQPIADTSGVQFIQFGPDLTLDTYTDQLGDALNQVLLFREDEVLYNRVLVKRKQLYMFYAFQEVKSRDQFERLRLEDKLSNLLELEVVGLTQFKESIIIGFRIPVEFKDQYWKVLDRFIFSIHAIID